MRLSQAKYFAGHVTIALSLAASTAIALHSGGGLTAAASLAGAAALCVLLTIDRLRGTGQTGRLDIQLRRRQAQLTRREAHLREQLLGAEPLYFAWVLAVQAGGSLDEQRAAWTTHLARIAGSVLPDLGIIERTASLDDVRFLEFITGCAEQAAELSEQIAECCEAQADCAEQQADHAERQAGLPRDRSMRMPLG